MSPKRDPSKAKGVDTEGKKGNVHSSSKNQKTKLTNIVMGPETQGEIHVKTQEINQQRSSAEYYKGESKRPYKQKRNTEQRRPAALTLDKFLVFLPKPIRRLLTPQKTQSQSSYMPKHIENLESNEIANTQQNAEKPIPTVITPQTSKKPRKHPTIQLEYHKEQTKKSKRMIQSKVYSREKYRPQLESVKKTK